MGTRLALVLAIVLGFIAAIGVKSWMKEKERQAAVKSQAVKIMAAKKRIRKGEVLKEKDTEVVLVQAQYVAHHMISWSDRMRFYGKIVKADLDPGVPVFEDLIEDSNQAAGVQRKYLVKDNMRAVTLDFDFSRGVGGLVKPGDYVDIVGTFNIKDFSRPGSSTAPAAGNQVPTDWKGINAADRMKKTLFLAQAVKVLAIDNKTIPEDYQKSSKRRQMYRTVTLQVKPVDALRLINASTKGDLQLLLRNPGEVEIVKEYTDPNTNAPLKNIDVINEVVRTTSKEGR